MSTSWPNRDAFGSTSAIPAGDLDAVQTALRKIYSQVTTADEWTALLRVLGTLGDDIEAVQTAIQTQTDASTATGASLDEIGAGVGARRNGLTDDEYRLAVIARGAALVGDGTIADVLAVLEIFDAAAGAVVLEYWPAKISVALASTTWTPTEVAVIARGIRDVVADGVGVISVSEGGDPWDGVAGSVDDALVWDGVAGSVTGAGEWVGAAYS